MGTHLPPARRLCLLFVAGVCLFYSNASPQGHALFTQHERQLHATARPNALCKPSPYETPISYTELNVFDSRDVVYEVSTLAPCLGERADPPWAVRWDALGGSKTVFRHRLSVQEFEQFKSFLDRAEVKGIVDFMNAGPGVGDFKISIARPSGVQNIEVVSLMPGHVQLGRKSALVQLICRAKDMARIASHSAELPEWCKDTDAKPLK